MKGLKCSNCVFHGVYRDHGASMDVCLFHCDLEKAINACNNSERCFNVLSLEEVKNIVLERGSKDEC